MDEIMNDMVTQNKSQTPLRGFNLGLSGLGGAKQKNSKYLFVTILILAIIIAGYFIIRFYNQSQDRKYLNTNLQNTLQSNEKVWQERMEFGLPPISNEAMRSGIDVVEQSLKNR